MTSDVFRIFVFVFVCTDLLLHYNGNQEMEFLSCLLLIIGPRLIIMLRS